MRTHVAVAVLSLLFVTSARWISTGAGADIEFPPINYSKSQPDNAITRFQEQIDSGKTKLTFETNFGYLRALLRELQISESSQVLVFSKTSMQRTHISPGSPRALYFNDDVYVGFCQLGTVLEVSAVDPRLGTVYYTLDQKPADKPRFARQNDACLQCHESSRTQGFPAHLLRSVYADSEGLPILTSATYRVDQCTPLRQRWGGWYVTGKSGLQTHMGNLIVHGERQPEQIDNSAGTNVMDLKPWFKTKRYLTPHSDLVALLVLEHQTEMHNLFTSANFLTRIALQEEAEINKSLGRPLDYRSESITSRINNAGDQLLYHLLFRGEARLTDRVDGTSGFAQKFAKLGPCDPSGRSLRDLDVEHRLFKYPCSYLIYSRAFDGLPEPVKAHVLRRLWEILTGKDRSEDFSYLTPADRRAILEILLKTKANLPGYWRS